jgi:beta-glucosidase
VLREHLMLTFDGRALHAASVQGTTYLGGRSLGSAWEPIAIGSELRFGFALLRVEHEGPSTQVKSSSGSSRKRLALLIGLPLLTLVFLTAVLVRALRAPDSSPVASSASPQPSGVAASQEPAVENPPAAAVDPSLAAPATPVEPAAPAAAAADEPVRLPIQALAPSAQVELARQPESPAPLLGMKPPAAYPQNIANRPVPRIGGQPWVIAPAWQAHHERLLRSANRKSAQVVFLGDSITEAWQIAPAYREAFAKYVPLNLGISGDTTQNVLWRLEHGALEGTQARAVVVMVGINNLAGGFSSRDTADGVRAVITSVQKRLPTASVLLLAILPAREEPSNPLRARIAETNRLLAGMAQPGRVDVRDVGATLLEPDGRISKATMGDFLHPTRDGFAKLSQAVAPLLAPLAQ